MEHGRLVFDSQDNNEDIPSNNDMHLERKTHSVGSNHVVCNSSSLKKPNSQLSKEEREEKRIVKKRIKLQAKISSLHRTIRHAKGRKDFITESSAKKALNDLMEKERKTIREMQLNLIHEEDPRSSPDVCAADMKQKAKSIILCISNALLKCCEARGTHDAPTSSGKERQISQAVTLLKHMTKGTQQRDMFQEKNTLWGYTRQKFYERALLLCASLARIQVDEKEIVGSNAAEEDEDLAQKEQLKFRQKVWNVFENGLIRKCCSIGCGPGNDLIGLQTFLRLCCCREDTDLLEKCVLMDWSINEWKDAVIDPLMVVLDKQGFISTNGIQTVFCDVTKDLHDEINHGAKEMFLEQNQDLSDFDIYLTSYLLSETRDKWFPFFKSVVSHAKVGSMFYFAEPVPWQLHRFIDCFQGELEFLWLDSSMNHPSLQKADRRTGPAILFAMKRSISQKYTTKNTM
jgi:hypothetical protein